MVRHWRSKYCGSPKEGRRVATAPSLPPEATGTEGVRGPTGRGKFGALLERRSRNARIPTAQRPNRRAYSPLLRRPRNPPDLTAADEVFSFVYGSNPCDRVEWT